MLSCFARNSELLDVRISLAHAQHCNIWFGFPGDAAEATQHDSSSAKNGENDDDAEEAAMTDLLTCLGLEEQKTQM